MMPCFATTLQMHQKYGFGEPQNDCVVKYTNAEKSAALVTTSIAYGVNRRRITAEVTVAENGSAMDWKVKNFDISGVYVATGR